MRFKARELVKGFSQALTGTKEASFPGDADDNLDLSTESVKKDQKSLNRNNLAASCLTMAFMTKDLMSKV